MAHRDLAPASPGTATLRGQVDAVLERFLAEQRAVAASADPDGAPLVDEIERVVRSGGKRLRPAFCYLGHLAAGGIDGEPILRAASSLELLHTFALIHDDVMDDASERRGAPTSHRYLEEEHLRRRRPGSAERFGRSAAVLAGDLALVLADELFLSSGFPEPVLLAAFRRYNRMRTEVAVGQYLDLGGAGSDVDEAGARRIAVLKSGSYTVEGPLSVGAVLAEASLDALAALARFGRPLGEAFQVADDIRGVTAGADLVHGKPTVLVAMARAVASPADREVLDEPEDAGRIRDVLVSTGAVDRARSLVRELVEEARTALATPLLEPDAVSGLLELASLIEEV